MNALTSPEFWSGLSGPGMATIVCVAFVWALATERLVLGKQYRAERERGDKYEDAHRTVTQALIEKNAGQEATIAIVSSFRKEIAELAAGAGR